MSCPTTWKERTANNYSPFASPAKFEFAEFLYVREEMSAKGVNHLAQLLLALYQGTDPPFADHTGTRLGRILSQSKEFFILDSLLGVFGVLLPAREVQAKRTNFVDTVFKSKVFSRSAKIKKLIAASSGKDWDPVSVEIIAELVKSDLSFNLRTNPRTATPNVNDVFYVDNKGLFANMDQDEVYTPWQVTFPSMERIKIGVPGTPSTSVSMQLTAPPVIGPSSEAEDQKQKKKCTMEFQLKNADAGRFLNTLKARGLSRLIADMKVSKTVEAVSLQFSSGQKPPQTQEEKVAKCGSPASQPKTPNCKHDSSSSANSDLPDPSSKHEAIDADELTNISDGEDKPPSKAAPKAKPSAPAAKVKTPPRRVRISEDSDDKQGAPVKPRVRKSAMKKRTIESYDEGEPTQSSPPSSHSKDQDFEPTQPPQVDPATQPRKVQTEKPTQPKSVKAEIASKRAEPKSGPKRPKVDEEEVPDSEEEEAEPPRKRLRGRQNDIVREEELEPVPPTRRVSAVFGTATHAPAKKRYGGKKGRTSFPAPDASAAADDTDMAIDYGELPTAPSPPPSPVAEKARKAVKPKPEPKTVSGVNDARKSRVAAMRGKGGQKPVAVKTPPKPTKAGPSGKNKKTQAAAAAEENADPESDHEIKPPRRLTRTTKPAEPIVEATTSKPKPKTKTEKPRKAPWEDIHLQKDDDVAMTDEPLPQHQMLGQ
ncbi:hypothetical protein K438DRAFT_1984589 [Mycena galopus ATCC 62051]|nr:hypothetical protein K438DRAFT_1984589 [Mycena galopus ATCC 62051]